MCTLLVVLHCRHDTHCQSYIYMYMYYTLYMCQECMTYSKGSEGACKYGFIRTWSMLLWSSHIVLCINQVILSSFILA